jgi:DNA primase large subunit
MLVAAAGDERACRRYAMAEAKRAYEYLKQENPGLLTQLAADTFGWDSKIANRTMGGLLYEIALSYPDYLRNAVKIRGLEWKLTNRPLERGYVYCSKSEFARLLEEEVEAKILSRISGRSDSVPAIIAPQIERLRKLVAVRAQMYAAEDAPKVVLAAAMPPCIDDLLSSLSTGKHVSHIGRFAVTAFLSNIGASDEEILKMFHTQSDFSERIARYQVQHISGSRSGGKKYIPPSCKTMKTHSLCINPDQLCATVAHPLAYYRRKARMAIAARRDKPAQVPVQAPTPTNVPQRRAIA